MASITTTTETVTYFEARFAEAGILASNATYTLVDSGFQFTNVPANSKIYINLQLSKIIAGTADFRLRDVTNNVTLWEVTGVTTAKQHISDITGTLTSHSVTGTVELQMLSSDANDALLTADTNGSSWICIVNASKILMISGGPQTVKLPGKRSINTIYGASLSYEVSTATQDTFTCSIAGLHLIGDSGLSTGVGDYENSLALNVMTSEIEVSRNSATPVWKDPANNSHGVVIVAYSGVNLEVTA